MALKDRLPRERLALVGLAAFVVAGGTYAVVKGQRQPEPIVFRELNGDLQTKEQSGQPTAGGEVIVHVAGAVKKPGVVRLSPGSRLEDAIRFAGGALPNADLDSINLAAKAVDGTQIFVPRRALDTITNRARGAAQQPTAAPKREITVGSGSFETPPEDYKGGEVVAPYRVEVVPEKSGPPPRTATGESKRTEKKALPAAPVSLNAADAAALQTLPGVGPATAQKILDYRREHGRFTSVDELLAVKGIGPKKLEALRPYVRL